MSEHRLTRRKATWLSDRRDASPLQRHSWVTDRHHEDWQWSIKASDFTEMIFHRSDLGSSLCVAGHWLEHNGSFEDEIHMDSALVPVADAESVANAVRELDETYWSALPRFGMENGEEGEMLSKLRGRIEHRDSVDKRIDEFDPYARKIAYPPREIGEPFLAMFNLKPDLDGREWRQCDAAELEVIREVWSEKRPHLRTNSNRWGERIHVSSDF